MSNCSKHLDHIENIPYCMEELVEKIGDLRYDTLSDMLQLLSDKIERDAKKDMDGGRSQLALELKTCSINLKKCKTNINSAWKISKPYMNI